MESPANPAAPSRRFAVLRDLLLALRAEALGFSLRSPRALLALRPVLSVALAVGGAHALGLHDTWWAAISAFVVMQEQFGASVWRGLLRIAGTLIGAGLGIVLGPRLAAEPVVFVLLMGVAAWIGLYGAMVFKHSYAWVLGLVTYVMVVCEAVAMPGDLADFARERVINIVLGALACMLVSGLSDTRLLAWLLRRPPPPAAAAAAGPALAERPVAALHALHGACAITLMAILVWLHELSAFPQAMVTAVSVLIVPLAGGEAAVRATVADRMAQRFAGCMLAGLFGFALLPLIGERPLLCQSALALGVWLGAYLQRGAAGVRYLAVQFSVAFLMVFVQDSGWSVNGWAALQRLAGVFAGIASLAIVIAVSMWIRRPDSAAAV